MSEYYTDEELFAFTQEELISIIKKHRNEIDELNGIQRNASGEEVMQDDKPVNDDEEVL